MTRRKRSLRSNPLPQKFETVRAALGHWSTALGALSKRVFSPRSERFRRVIPGIEILEARVMPTTVQFEFASYGDLTGPREGGSSTGIRVMLDAPSNQTVTVNVATSNGTARAGVDYTALRAFGRNDEKALISSVLVHSFRTL